MKRFILIQVILLSIGVIGCASSVNTNVSVNRANTQASNTVVVTNANRQTANVQPTNRQATSNPAPPTAKKKDEGLFSFPPPRAVGYDTISNQQLLNREGQTILSDVSQKLEEGLKNAGYLNDKYRYFWNNDNEFAIITAMERINADGTPFTDNARWESLDILPTAQNLSEYIKYLIGGKKVYYRVFALIVSKEDYSSLDNSPPSFNMAKKWMQKGKPELSGSATSILREVPFDEQYRCHTLLYLFVNHSSLDYPKPIDDDELKGTEKGLMKGLSQNPAVHLQQTQIKFGG